MVSILRSTFDSADFAIPDYCWVLRSQLQGSDWDTHMSRYFEEIYGRIRDGIVSKRNVKSENIYKR